MQNQFNFKLVLQKNGFNLRFCTVWQTSLAHQTGLTPIKLGLILGFCGCYDPVTTRKLPWGSPGAELSTWPTFQFAVFRSIQRTRIVTPPSRRHTAIQPHTTLYGNTAIQHHTPYIPYNTPLRTKARIRLLPALSRSK